MADFTAEQAELAASYAATVGARLAAKPDATRDPEAALGRREFFDVMDFCLEKLPANTARVFMMREVMELESDEICQELRITSNNLWVILYRARMALRAPAWQRSGAAGPAQGGRHDQSSFFSGRWATQA